jgi:hypothetical protein
MEGTPKLYSYYSHRGDRRILVSTKKKRLFGGFGEFVLQLCSSILLLLQNMKILLAE